MSGKTSVVSSQSKEGSLTPHSSLANRDLDNPIGLSIGPQASERAQATIRSGELKSASLIDQLSSPGDMAPTRHGSRSQAGPGAEEPRGKIQRRVQVTETTVSPSQHAQIIIAEIEGIERRYEEDKARSDQLTSAGAVVRREPQLAGKREAFLPRAYADVSLSGDTLSQLVALREETNLAIHNLAASMPQLAHSDKGFEDAIQQDRRDLEESWKRQEATMKPEWEREKKTIDASTKFLSKARASADKTLKEKQQTFYAERESARKELEAEIKQARALRQAAIEQRRETVKLIERLYQAQAKAEFKAEANFKSHQEWLANLQMDSARERGDSALVKDLQQRKRTLNEQQNDYRIPCSVQERAFQDWLKEGANPEDMLIRQLRRRAA